VIHTVEFANETGNEVFFQAREGENRQEDDGYLMLFLYDWEKERSSFCVWDAKTMEEVMRA